MKKYVNGKVVDIRDAEVFELGFEGVALNKYTVSNISDQLDGEPELVRVCVEQYCKMYNSLPFPMYAIETDIKYCAMAIYIKDKVAELMGIPLKLWVDRGIMIWLSDKRVLKIVGSTWGINKNDMYEEELTEEQEESVNLERYVDDTGYTEFKWCLIQLMNGKDLSGFYNEFLKGFEEACMGQPMVMKWELSRLLDFGYVPERQATESNIVRNIDNGRVYQIDVFWTGKMKPVRNGEKVMVFDMTSGGQGSYMKTRQEKEYNFDIFEIAEGGTRRRLKEEKLAFSGLLYTLVEIGKDNDRVERVVYSGLTDGDILAFDIEGTLYLGSANKSLRAIGTGVTLWAIEKSKVYMEKRIKLGTGAYKYIYYSYEPKGDKLKLCKVEFRDR